MKNLEATSPKFKRDDEIERYGLFHPNTANDVSIELKCYLENRTPAQGGLGREEHFRKAIQLLFPPSQKRYIWHPWVDRRLNAWCAEIFQTWWGPAASAKSTDAAMMALVDWAADPYNTTTIICSTTLKMLKRRIFGEVVRFHRMQKGVIPGNYVKSRTCIELEEDENDTSGEDSEKSGIFGFAVQQGDKKKARDDIIGQHNKRVRLVVDEAQHPALEVAFEARSNLTKGCDDFKLLAFGNPDSRLDPLGRYSEPALGWDSIDMDMLEWKTKRGKCFFFDGKHSPGLEDPEKYWFLIKQSDFDKTEKDYGSDSPEYWQFDRGFVRPEGSSLQIISETFAIQNHMTEEVKWMSTFEGGAGLDPAYSSGGDKCIFMPFQYGLSMDGIKTIAFQNPVHISIEVSKLAKKTTLAQISERVIDECSKRGIRKEHFGMDTTGAQSLLADRIDELWEDEGVIHRTEFGGAATDLRASAKDSNLASDVYANRVTELWFNMVMFGKGNQIRRLPSQALREFTIREIVAGENRRMRSLKKQIEPKPLMKERTGGKSPDYADAACVCLDVARHRCNIHPGLLNSKQSTQKADWVAQDLDVDSQELYQDDGIGDDNEIF